MNIKALGGALLMAGALSLPAYAGTSLEAYTGVIGGSNTLCSGAGGPVPAISAYFLSAGGFGLLTPNTPGRQQHRRLWFERSDQR